MLDKGRVNGRTSRRSPRPVLAPGSSAQVAAGNAGAACCEDLRWRLWDLHLPVDLSQGAVTQQGAISGGEYHVLTWARVWGAGTPLWGGRLQDLVAPPPAGRESRAQWKWCWQGWSPQPGS